MDTNSTSPRVCSSSDDEMCIYSLCGGSQPASRASKADRSTDDRCAWSRTGWAGHVDAKLRENSWHTYYHMPLQAFNVLHAMLFTETEQEQKTAAIKALNSTPMGRIETQVKLASTLRELFGEKRKSMVDVFKISPTSARAAFMDVINRINNCAALEGDIFSTNHSPEVLTARAFAFARRSFYPDVFRHCVGAIDGLFIKTEQPCAKEVGNVRTYWSGHKKNYGINMQGVCDAQCRFIGFACNTPGSTNDYVAFRHSFFYGHWTELPSPFYYLGDCAYPLSEHCMTPYIGSGLVQAQDAFNFYHSQLRITIERCFGIFVNVFGIFHAPLKFDISTCCQIVEACVRIHNFRINQGCQHVTRRSCNGAVYREAMERGGDVFDVLDDPRYATDRPHVHDHAYGNYVNSAEVWAGQQPGAAALGDAKRSAVKEALAQLGAARPV
jgi:hypothetical protein